MSRRTIPRKCPKCNGPTYITDTLTRRCEDGNCAFFFTGIAVHFYKLMGMDYNVSLFEDGKLVHSYIDGKHTAPKLEVTI